MLMGGMWLAWITSRMEVGYLDACRCEAGSVDARHFGAIGIDAGEFEVMAAMSRKVRRMSGAIAWWKMPWLIPWIEAMQSNQYPDLIWMLLMLPLWV